MLKIKIESTNPTLGNQLDSCEVCEADKNSLSSSEEFVFTFLRAMLGSAFTLEVVLDGMQEVIDFYKNITGLEESEENK
jgi:hypothetical protein